MAIACFNEGEIKMYIAYCKKCNQFSYISKTRNYCKKCKTLLICPEITVEEYNNLSVNDRYKLAYKLTNGDI